MSNTSVEIDTRPILIVDAMSVFIRHFLANPAVSTRGEFSGGVVGFLSSLGQLTASINPKTVIVVWDAGGGSQKKRGVFADYKMHRKPQKMNRAQGDDIPTTVENRNWQVTTVVGMLRHLPLIQLFIENCEADDVVGYLCKYKYLQEEKVVVSSDRDFYQLLDENMKIFSPTSKSFVDSEAVKEKFGISPRNFCLAKAVCGDASDNIPGVGGVGFAGLAKKFPEFLDERDMTIDELISKAKLLNEEKSLKIYKQIIDGEDIIRRNWKLVLLDTANLSADQVKKINDTFTLHEAKKDKLGFLKKLVKEGLGTFDADRFFVSFNNLQRLS